MRLEFVPVEEFFFALTLSVRLLEEIDDQELLAEMRSHLCTKYGQSSTIAAAQDNTFNYVFRLFDYEHSPEAPLMISISDWNGKLRLSSDYGWTLSKERKPVRTDQFTQRSDFTQQLKAFLQKDLNILLTEHRPPSASEK